MIDVKDIQKRTATSSQQQQWIKTNDIINHFKVDLFKNLYKCNHLTESNFICEEIVSMTDMCRNLEYVCVDKFWPFKTIS